LTGETGKPENRETVIRDHFEGYAAKWHQRLKVHPYAVRHRVISELIAGLKKNTVVDIGCGTGDYSTLFNSELSQYTGYDISPEMIKQCRLLYPGAAFEVGSAEMIPATDNSVDFVLSVAVFEYYEVPTPQVKELHRIIAGDGSAIICVPNKSNVTKLIMARIDRWILLPLGVLLRVLRGRKIAPAARESQQVKAFKHKQYSDQEIDEYSRIAGFQVTSHRYAATHFLPTTFEWLRRLDTRISEFLSGRTGLNWLTKYAGTILICRLEK